MKKIYNRNRDERRGVERERKGTSEKVLKNEGYELVRH